MAWKPIHFALAGMMLLFGSFNTLSVKWADTMTSESVDGTKRPFNHPFLQATGMFLGEMLCMLAFWVTRWRANRQPAGSSYPPLSEENAPKKFNPLVFLPPALCDMTATSVQYIGLTLTYASSFQMLRGAVIIFTGILSTIFLKRKLAWFKWAGMVWVIGGLVTVGVSDMLNQKDCNPSDHNTTESAFHPKFNLMSAPISLATSEPSCKNDTTNIFVGDLLIFCSQVIVASQMVYEEKFITKYNVPALQAVGWEGTFGFTTLALLLIPFSFIYVGPEFGNNPRHVLEDAYDGVFQLAHNPLLALAFTGTVISIAFFNFAGISVTKELSATTRMVLDSVRTLVIWMVSIAVGWQNFYLLQLGGFCILVTGMCLYNDIIILPTARLIGVKLGVIQPEVADYRDLTEDIDAEGDGERDVEISKEDNDQDD